MRTVITIVALALLLSTLAGAPASGNEQAKAGRQLVGKWKDAVVTAFIVLKTGMSYGGSESGSRESKVEVTGTVIDPSGLIVVSLSATNPEEIYRRMTGTESSKIDITSEVTSIKVLFSDGQEAPAKMVLRDRDLDLAFIRLKTKPAKPLHFVDLAKATSPELLDGTVILSRLGTEAGRALSASFDNVQCIIEKPQTYYIPGLPALASSLGAPVFSLDSNIVGILLLRVVPSAVSSNTTRTGNLLPPGLMYVVLPASQVLEVAKQAPAE